MKNYISSSECCPLNELNTKTLFSVLCAGNSKFNGSFEENSYKIVWKLDPHTVQ